MVRSNDSLKVIVVGIPKTLDDAALSEIFAHYGSVADAKVVLDVNTNASRGFGFVTFTAQAAMRRAIKEMDKKQLEGRTLNVRQLVPKDKFTKDDGKSAGVSDLAKRPCYLLRKGKCNKGDRCPFSHEIKSGEFGSCFEYVQNGFCKRGDNCKFFHPPPPEDQDEEDAEAAQAAEAAPVKPAEKKQEKTDKKTDKKVDAKAAEEPKKEKKDAKEPRGVAKPKDDKPRYCFAYQTGRCHRGKRCLFLHEKLEVAERDAPPAPVQKKRPSDFEVVTEEPSKKRRRDSDEETESEDDDEEEETVPVAKAPVAKAPVAKAPKAKAVEKKAPKAAPKVTEKKEETETEAAATDEKPALDADGKPIHTGPKPICRHFAKGRCKRGHICFFRHERAPVEPVAEEEVVEEEEDATPLQAVADHVASFMANFNSNAAPFVPSASMAAAPASPVKPVVKKVGKTVKTEETKSSPVPAKALKRKAEEVEETVNEVEESHAPSDDNDVAVEADAQEEVEPVAKKPRTHFKKEKVDMGAAFDGVDSDDEPRKGGRRMPRQKVTKEQMKANREKLREERRAKRTTKKQARERLRTDGEIELEA